jgi:hypothetical protein
MTSGHEIMAVDTLLGSANHLRAGERACRHHLTHLADDP